MKRLFSLLAGLLLLTPAALPQQKPGWRLTFHDEFDGTRLDPAKWNPEDPWGRVRNRELQAYVKDAFEVRDGILRIKAEKRPAEYDGAVRQYTSGMLTTYRKFPQKFGWFEIRCRVPKGNGLWPAFWMLPEPLGWPPEIDVLENLGQDTQTVYFTNHFMGPDGKRGSKGSGKLATPDVSAGFHTYAVEWTQDAIVWYFDGVEKFRSSQGVPQQPMYVLVNLAIGGAWPVPPDETTPWPSYFDVDYVRIYARE
jgi:beta-glucanase (GH16 family)